MESVTLLILGARIRESDKKYFDYTFLTITFIFILYKRHLVFTNKLNIVIKVPRRNNFCNISLSI